MAERTTVTWKGGTEHWTAKGEVKLFLWNKKPAAGTKAAGTIFFVHGSSMASQPTFDLSVPGRPDSSAMDWFAARGYDTWTMDNEGYGRSDKNRPQNNDISNGADDLEAGSRYIMAKTGAKKLMVYGISSGALKAALFAERKKKLAQFQSMLRRPIDRPFVHSIFARDHPGTADDTTIDAFADAILTLDDSMPTGTYVDMCSRLPLIDPAKVKAATLVMRGEYDGIAGFDDLIEFFKRLPNADKQFSVMAGISHASFQQKNYQTVYHILHAFFAQPEAVYRA